MASQAVAGISVGDNSLQLVALKTNELKTELLYIDEYERTNDDNSNTWFLKPLTINTNRLFKVVSVALEKQMVFIHTFPLDSSLSRDEIIEHSNWELSQLLPNFYSQKYISDFHVLSEHSDEKRNDILSVTVERSIVYGIHDYAAKAKLKLNIIDAAHFATEGALFFNYPEAISYHCILVGLSKKYSEFSYYSKGHLEEYEFRFDTNLELVVQYLKGFLKNKNVNGIFLYGHNADIAAINILKPEISSNINILNPFERITISNNVKNFEKFSSSAQRFAPAVGIALRKA